MDILNAKNNVEKTDVELVQIVLGGDKNAFAEIVERHIGGAYKFAFRYLKSQEDAEDVAQEAFVRVWKNLKKFDASKNFRTWLFAIVKNAALDLIKKKKPLLFSQISEEDGALDSFLAPYSTDEELPDMLFERRMIKVELARLMSALPPAYRTVLTMRYNDNLKFREIAEALNEPIDTVKSKHRRGLALLRKIMPESSAMGSSLA